MNDLKDLVPCKELLVLCLLYRGFGHDGPYQPLPNRLSYESMIYQTRSIWEEIKVMGGGGNQSPLSLFSSHPSYVKETSKEQRICLSSLPMRGGRGKRKRRSYFIYVPPFFHFQGRILLSLPFLYYILTGTLWCRSAGESMAGTRSYSELHGSVDTLAGTCWHFRGGVHTSGTCGFRLPCPKIKLLDISVVTDPLNWQEGGESLSLRRSCDFISWIKENFIYWIIDLLIGLLKHPFDRWSFWARLHYN